MRYGFSELSKVVSKWIKDNKTTPTEDYKKVLAIFNRQKRYSTLRTMMIGKGMYTVNSDMEAEVNINASTKFTDAFPTTSGGSSSSGGGAVNGDLPGFGG